MSADNYRLVANLSDYHNYHISEVLEGFTVQKWPLHHHSSNLPTFLPSVPDLEIELCSNLNLGLTVKTQVIILHITQPSHYLLHITHLSSCITHMPYIDVILILYGCYVGRFKGITLSVLALALPST